MELSSSPTGDGVKNPKGSKYLGFSLKDNRAQAAICTLSSAGLRGWLTALQAARGLSSSGHLHRRKHGWTEVPPLPPPKNSAFCVT